MAARGFTLIEIVIVFAIAAVLLWIAVPAVSAYLERARVAQAVTEITDMSTKIRQKMRAEGKLPDALSEVSTIGNTTDPWGRPYEYVNLADSKGNGQARKDKKTNPLNSDFDLYSVGADGKTKPQVTQKDSRDDIIRARDGAFIGLASDFDP
jgi:general secretion pathway protein G